MSHVLSRIDWRELLWFFLVQIDIDRHGSLPYRRACARTSAHGAGSIYERLRHMHQPDRVGSSSSSAVRIERIWLAVSPSGFAAPAWTLRSAFRRPKPLSSLVTDNTLRSTLAIGPVHSLNYVLFTESHISLCQPTEAEQCAVFAKIAVLGLGRSVIWPQSSWPMRGSR